DAPRDAVKRDVPGKEILVQGLARMSHHASIECGSAFIALSCCTGSSSSSSITEFSVSDRPSESASLPAAHRNLSASARNRARYAT
ncbi:hypothetical protein SB771_35550, partial [Burkholderia sp. SIMBA_051]